MSAQPRCASKIVPALTIPLSGPERGLNVVLRCLNVWAFLLCLFNVYCKLPSVNRHDTMIFFTFLSTSFPAASTGGFRMIGGIYV